MNNRAISPMLRLLAGTALLLCASLAQAQYVWIDDKGVRQYSDRPPPPSTPASKILKTPRPHLISLEPVPEAVAAKAESKPKGPPTLAEREADYRKRTEEQAKRDTKAADEAQLKAARAENCELARRAKAQFESGVRVATTGSDGQRGFMSDEQRAQEVARTNKILDACR